MLFHGSAARRSDALVGPASLLAIAALRAPKAPRRAAGRFGALGGAASDGTRRRKAGVAVRLLRVPAAHLQTDLPGTRAAEPRRARALLAQQRRHRERRGAEARLRPWNFHTSQSQLPQCRYPDPATLAAGRTRPCAAYGDWARLGRIARRERARDRQRLELSQSICARLAGGARARGRVRPMAHANGLRNSGCCARNAAFAM